MLTALMHWWRLLTEPSGKGRLQIFGSRRWRVRYTPRLEFPDGAFSAPLAYDVACDYAELWGGVVERVPPTAEPPRRPLSDADLWESDPHNLSN